MGESKFGNDVDWARFYLVRTGYLDSSKRGVWSLTEAGNRITIDGELAAEIIRNVDGRIVVGEPARSAKAITSEDREPYVEVGLERIRSLPPKGFESLCQRLLRESGFEEVKVMAKVSLN